MRIDQSGKESPLFADAHLALGVSMSQQQLCLNFPSINTAFMRFYPCAGHALALHVRSRISVFQQQQHNPGAPDRLLLQEVNRGLHLHPGDAY